MKIKSVTFGSAVRFRGSMENHVIAKDGVEIEFDKGVVFVKSTQGKLDCVGVFTSNVKYFVPDMEPVAEDLKRYGMSVDQAVGESVARVSTYLIPSDELVQENTGDIVFKRKPGRKPKVNG